MLPDGSGVTQLTHNDASDDAPSWSADGGKIAFASDRDGNVEVYVMDWDGSNETRLTNDPSVDAQPAWSPDGSKIAFISDRGAGGDFDVYVMNADGSGITQLTDLALHQYDAAWSPDGTKIAFTGEIGGIDDALYTINPDGTGLTQLTLSGSSAGADWSPDGSKIAFTGRTSMSPLNYDIYTMNPDGANVQQLTFTDTIDEASPAWSPDGTRIAVSREPDGADALDVAVMDSDGSNVTVITDPQDGFDPNWQPNCVSICFPTPTPCPTEGCPTATPTPSPTATITPTPAPPAEMALHATGTDPCPPSESADYCAQAGSMFSVAAQVTAPGVGYIGIETEIDYGALTYVPAPVADEIIWPNLAPSFELRSPINPTGTEGLVNHSAAIAKGPPFPASTYLGDVVTITLTCDGGLDHVIALVPESGSNTNGTALMEPGPSYTILPFADSITVSCIAPQASPGDTDGDGCTDMQEIGTMEAFGGRRNFLNFWDLYDVWTSPGSGSYWGRNATIDLFGDIFHVAYRFGAERPGGPPTEQEALAEALTPPPDPPVDVTTYHAGYDRSAPPMGADPWDMGSPDGTIDLFTDIFGVAMQFAHSCY